MKWKSKIKLLTAMVGLAVVGLVMWESLAPPQAQAQTPVGVAGAPSFAAFTNMPTTVLLNSNAVINSGIITLRANQGIAILPIFAFTNGNAGTNVQFSFTGSPDLTNWTTSAVFSMTVAGNGSTGVVGYTNVPPTWLNNIRYLRVSSITNQHTSTLFLTNILYSFTSP